MPFIRSISGLRATLGNDLTREVVVSYAAAFSAILPDGPIVVGSDGRPSGEWIQKEVIGALHSCGRTVRALGVVPTPTVQLLTETTDAVGGIAITASHNPAEWNGLKFLDAGGVFLDAAANHQLWNQVDTSSFDLTSSQQNGQLEHVADAIQQHLAAVQKIESVKSAPLSGGEIVIVDAVNCSGSVIVPALLRSFGYNVIELYCDGTGIFPHTPEPLAENLKELGAAVKKHNAAFGVAVDPDADRLVLYDGDGEAIGEERTITLASRAIAEFRMPDAKSIGEWFVVVNYSTTRAVDDVAEKFGGKAIRAAVGEINVVRKMQEVGAVIGGEGSGGVILPECHAGRDSLVGLGLITSYLRRNGLTLKQAVAELPTYSMTKTKFELNDRNGVAELLNELADELQDGAISREDGLFTAYSDRWIHIRASNTEPILRVIAESPTADETAALIERAASIVRRAVTVKS